jgi:threonine aldolase
VERLAEDHANAKRFAKGIADLKGLNVDVEHVDTNIVLIHLTDEEASSLDAVAELKERGVSVVPFGKRTMRAVTHLDVTRTDIDRAIAIFMEHFGA